MQGRRRSWVGVALLLAALAWVPSRTRAQQSVAPTQQNASSVLRERTLYALRAGDTVTLEYRYTPEFNQTVTIRPDGFVDLQLAGEVHAAGMTVDQLHALVSGKASTRLKDPEITITLKEFERPYFVVAGEVPHPGKFDFYEKTTALQAVLLAGGFSETAQQSDVYVFRKVNGELAEVHALNLKKMQHGGDLERDLVLEPGDMILVPRNKLAHVGRFVKATNLSLYFDPLTYTPH